MKKRLLACLLALIMCITVLPTVALAAEGDTVVTYAVEGGSILFDTATGIITNSETSVTAANIPANIEGVRVTTIGHAAFNYHKSLTSMTLPDSITTIGDWAFAWCDSLSNITIPDSVREIGDYAFYTCPSLTDIYYTGTEEQWNNIDIGGHNTDLLNATIHYNGIGNPGSGGTEDDRPVEVKEEIHQLKNWDVFTNTVFFHDGSSYLLADIYGSVNLNDLLNCWVRCTIQTSSSGSVLIDMEKLESKTWTEVKKLKSYDPLEANGRVYFHDGSSYRIEDDVLIDLNDLLNRWVVCTINSDSSEGIRITSIQKLTNRVTISISMNRTEVLYNDNQLRFEGGEYQDKADFEIPYRITVVNKISYNADDEILAALRADPSFDVEITDVKIEAPEGFNFGYIIHEGEVKLEDSVTLHADESWTGEGFIRAGTLYRPSEETNEYNLAATVQTSIGDGKVAQTFTVKDVSESESEDASQEDKISEETSNWIEGFLKNLYNLDDINVATTQTQLKAYFNSETFKDISRIVYLWKTAMDTDMVQNAPWGMPDYLKIECTINGSGPIVNSQNSHSRHEATIYFEIKESSYVNGTAGIGTIWYTLVDEETQAVLSESLYSANVWLDSKEFATAFNNDLKKQYESAWKDFFKKLGEEAVFGIVGFTGLFSPSKQECLDSLLNVAKNLDSIVEAADEFCDFNDFAYDTFPSVLKTSIAASTVTKGTMERELKELNIECPADVYVYNPQGQLCAAIEDNVITVDTAETFINVIDDKKTVWVSNNDYTVKLVATDEGEMDYTIREYADGEESRTVFFDAVPLSTGVIYECNVPKELAVSSSDYALTSNTGLTIYADSDTFTEAASEALPFSDVPESAWYYDYVEYVCANGLMVGTSDVTFEPMGTVTRGTLMTILARLDGTDTTDSDPWYQAGMEWAVAAGVSDGTDPEGTTTREQVATMLWRYTGQLAVAENYLAEFDDADEIHDWAAQAMNWAVSVGVITGGDNGLDPQGTATRAELAAMLTRFCENVL